MHALTTRDYARKYAQCNFFYQNKQFAVNLYDGSSYIHFLRACCGSGVNTTTLQKSSCLGRLITQAIHKHYIIESLCHLQTGNAAGQRYISNICKRISLDLHKVNLVL